MIERPAAEHALLAGAVLAWCAIAAATLVPLSRRMAVRLGVMDAPGHRKIHAVPMPRLGGVAVFLTFTTTVLAGYAAIPLMRALDLAIIASPLAMLGQANLVVDKLAGVLLGAAAVFIVGALDDALGIRFPALAKLAGQFLAAGILVAFGVRTTLMPAEWMNVGLTLLWVVGITNAFNFLDNMDGLCAGVAAISCVVLLINAWARGEFFIALILAAFIGCLIGFLRHNFAPATVFLGDCGSHFIGFTMASLTLLERYVTSASSLLFPVLMPVLVLAVPLLDTATVMVIRAREGRPLYRGDKSHLSHRLVALGFSTRKAVLSIYLATFCFGLGAILLPDATVGQSALVLLQAFGFAALLVGLMFHDRSVAAEQHA